MPCERADLPSGSLCGRVANNGSTMDGNFAEMSESTDIVREWTYRGRRMTKIAKRALREHAYTRTFERLYFKEVARANALGRKCLGLESQLEEKAEQLLKEQEEKAVLTERVEALESETTQFAENLVLADDRVDQELERRRALEDKMANYMEDALKREDQLEAGAKAHAMLQAQFATLLSAATAYQAQAEADKARALAYIQDFEGAGSAPPRGTQQGIHYARAIATWSEQISSALGIPIDTEDLQRQLANNMHNAAFLEATVNEFKTMAVNFQSTTAFDYIAKVNVLDYVRNGPGG